MTAIMISGGSGAIGKGIAKTLLNKRYKVILIGRDANKLTSAQSELSSVVKNADIKTYSIDITDEQQVINGVAKIWQENQIIGLINAAGIGEPVDFFCSTDKDWQECVQSKLLGTIKMTKETAKLMAKTQTKGKIIIINGTFCYDPHPDFIIHSTVNAALAGFTKAASKYLASKGICLNTLNPWITDSPSWQNTAEILAKLHHTDAETLNANFQQMNPLKKFTQVNDIGHTILFLLSEQADYINGATINLDGGASVGY